MISDPLQRDKKEGQGILIEITQGEYDVHR